MKYSRREFVRTLFVASQAVVAGQFLPGRLLAETTAVTPEGLNFLVFGDWGRQAERDQVEVAAQMAKAAKVTKPEFIISVGDNFYENGVTSVHDSHWQKSFEGVYGDPALQVPWHCILGNHDYHGDCDAQIAYNTVNPRWNMPARYYQQTHRLDAATTADLFYLDTTPMLHAFRNDPRSVAHAATQDVPRQMEWLKSALSASQAQWKILFAHHPIYSGGGHGDTPELIANVLPLLHEHGVQAYFNGHDHDLQHLRAGKVDLFCTGAGSQHTPTFYTRHSQFAESCSGFTTVSLQPEKMEVRLVDKHGTTVHAATMARA